MRTDGHAFQETSTSASLGNYSRWLSSCFPFPQSLKFNQALVAGIADALETGKGFGYYGASKADFFFPVVGVLMDEIIVDDRDNFDRQAAKFISCALEDVISAIEDTARSM